MILWRGRSQEATRIFSGCLGFGDVGCVFAELSGRFLRLLWANLGQLGAIRGFEMGPTTMTIPALCFGVVFGVVEKKAPLILSNASYIWTY